MPKMISHKARLFVNTDLTKQQDVNDASAATEIEGYSITPTTLKCKEFLMDHSTGIGNLKVKENPFSKDTFKSLVGNKEIEVIRFGINPSYNKLTEIFEQYNESKEVQEYNPSSAAKTKKTNATSSTLSKQEQDIVTKIISLKDKTNFLTEIERKTFATAKKYLDYSKDNSVLIDIFVRDAKQKIPYDPVKSTATFHTLVLHKQGNYYLVIDPSNSEFSQILQVLMIMLEYVLDKKLRYMDSIQPLIL